MNDTIQKSETMEHLLESLISIEGLKSFLASKYVKGVGKVYAGKIAETSGKEILDPNYDFEKLRNAVLGVPSNKIDEVKESLETIKFDPKVAAMLFSAGMKDVEVDKIISHYGKKAEEALLEDPYDMVENAWKVSFFTADKLGKWLSIANNDPRRIRGALLTAVKFYAERGNLFATEGQAVRTAAALTEVEEVKAIEQLEELIREERLIRSKDGIYLPVYFHAEKNTAKKLTKLIGRNFPHSDEDFKIPDKDMNGNPLNAEQIEALKTVINHPVTVITGGPGTGKTTTVRGIVRLFEDMDRKVVLVAPTGRAAKRLSDLAGAEAKTIHRLLGYSMGRGYRNKRFSAGILVIDEASMLEQVIFAHLLDALDPDTKIVLVGDTNQLPAIGAGDVLNEMIESGTIPVVRLTENFRQKAGSDIASTAEAIRLGIGPQKGSLKDFILIPEKNQREITERILQLISNDIPKEFGIDSKDIQVVSPQQDGHLGTKELNLEIQRRVNPKGPELRAGLKILRKGDRVMQTENSSERNVYNGETGWISEVNEEEKYLVVTFHDGKQLRYGRDRLRELSLAYATTVHKLQGSETDYMIMILSSAHKNMLYRNLLYTGISRARKLCVLVGEERAIETALGNETLTKRNSNLALRLRNALPQLSAERNKVTE